MELLVLEAKLYLWMLYQLIEIKWNTFWEQSCDYSVFCPLLREREILYVNFVFYQ